MLVMNTYYGYTRVQECAMSVYVNPAKIPRLLAHRGASRLMTENTLQAFQKCKEIGALGTELDVQVCASGDVVVFHDYDLKRLAGENFRIAEMSYEQLREIPLNTPTEVIAKNKGQNPCPHSHIPHFDSVLEVLGRNFFIDIEVKIDPKQKNIQYRKIAEQIESCLNRHNHRHCIVSSFNKNFLHEYKKISPQALALIYSEADSNALSAHSIGAQHLPFDFFKPEHPCITAYQGFPQKNRIITWTVDDEQTMNALHTAGVKSIITNRIEDFVQKQTL